MACCLLVAMVLALLLGGGDVGAVNPEGVRLLEAKRALSVPDGTLADWDPRDATPCNWTGVSCDDGDGAVTGLSVPEGNLAGSFPGAALCRLPRLRSVNLYMNYIGPDLAGIGRCRALRRLDLSMNALVGPLPDALAGLPDLVYLDLSSNNFSGSIPESFGRFPKLQSLSLVYNLLGGRVPSFLGGVPTLRELNLSYNPFAPGPVPSELGRLSALRVLWLAGCNLVGPIPPSLGRLGNLTDLDLSSNALTGPIPQELATGLASAAQMELYNNSLSGPIPAGFGALRQLRSLDLAMNRLSGAIPGDLFQAPRLQTLHLYANSLTGPVPESAATAPSLVELRLFANRLNGTLPAGLGRNAPLVCVDVSDNAISGGIPPGICDRGELEELLMLHNALSGPIPEALGRCRSLRRVRLSGNRLTGEVPAAVWGLPHVSLLELSDNRLSGGISPAIAGAANLTKLVLSNNRLTGSIPSEIGAASRLYELSADGNMLSGPLPGSLVAGLPDLGRLVLRNNSLSGHMLRGIGIGIEGGWRKLSELNLAHNALTGPIPPELGGLPVLNYLDLSGNQLTGPVPPELENLKLNLLDVSDNQLGGPLPPQYATPAYRGSFQGNPELCRDNAGLCEAGRRERGKGMMMRSVLVLALAGVVLVGGVAWFGWRRRRFDKSKQSNRWSRWTVTSFHKLPLSDYEILECVGDEGSAVIGSGASGKVYKAVLSNGEAVAVKRLWGKEDEFDAEVRTLGKIRHKNIVKLWCCCAAPAPARGCRLLVYEYMPNGSLGDALQPKKKKQQQRLRLLDWAARYKIALDAAEGLSYLHHDCVPPIVHRDVKSNNILLDADLGARVADFGVAKVMSANATMSAVAGSCGYIAPEYAYTLRVNEKSDTYSFGVVLLELVTGKPPVDPDQLGDKDLVTWVRAAMLQDHQVLDAALLTGDSIAAIKEEMLRVLHIGLLCASSLPINRPTMRRVVKMLQEVRAPPPPPRIHNNLCSPPWTYPYYFDDDTSSDQASSTV